MTADNETGEAVVRAGPEEWLTEVRRCEREGELFRAFDLARQGLAWFPEDLKLKHRAVLCLASSGATRQALDLMDRLGLDAVAGGRRWKRRLAPTSPP